jgi:hypothetical protein
MNCLPSSLICAALLSIAHDAATGQSAGLSSRAPVAPAAESAPATGRAFVGAVLGGAAGALVGGLTGLYVGSNRCYEPANPDSCDWIRGTAVGTVVGITVGTPVGAHLMNRRRGALGWSLVASAVVGGLGIIAFKAVDDPIRGESRRELRNAVLISVPVLQVITSTLIETRSGRR